MTPRELAQRQLIDYLNQDVDPYDFQYLMSDWNPTRADELDNQVDLLAEEELAQFTKWLRSPEGQKQLNRELTADSPSYLFFSNARAVPKGHWLMHFTRETPFNSFKYGAFGHELGLTTHFRDRKRNVAKCPENAWGDLGLFETVYGFAFDVTNLQRLQRHIGPHKYGLNAVLFQHNHAVVAHHYGDAEDQVIFPLCGEYNAVPIYNVEPQGLGGTVSTDDGERQFDSWQDIAKWAAPAKRRKIKRLAGLAQPSSRWAPGVRVKRGTFLGITRE